jgi:hypothetical protein
MSFWGAKLKILSAAVIFIFSIGRAIDCDGPQNQPGESIDDFFQKK